MGSANAVGYGRWATGLDNLAPSTQSAGCWLSGCWLDGYGKANQFSWDGYIGWVFISLGTMLQTTKDKFAILTLFLIKGNAKNDVSVVLLAGAFAGTCAGLFGVGGGLIIVPVLMAILKLMAIKRCHYPFGGRDIACHDCGDIDKLHAIAQ